MTRWWIGADVNTEESECPFCHQHQDKSGHHATVCNTNGERISRHNAIRDVIYGMASQAALSPQLEKQYILPGTQMKPADLYTPTWSAGKPLAIDISVVSPTQSHLLLYNHTQTEKLCAAQWREEQKNTKYLEALHSQNILFIPMAVETFGMGVGEQTSFCHSCG